ncbi:MAG: hypothetical protein ACFFAJ_10710, partial [Candidatus Hodarchaeota archaeon]
PMLNDFSNMIHQFSTNITELGYQLRALEHTFFAMQSFSVGVDLFNQSWNNARTTGVDGADTLSIFTSDPRQNQSQDLMQFAINNASLGHGNLSQATTIPNEVRTSWQNMLYSPTPPQDPETLPPNIAGLANGVLKAIWALWTLDTWATQDPQNVLVQQFIDNMDNIGLSTIFGGGS